MTDSFSFQGYQIKNNSLKSNVVICGTHVNELNALTVTNTSIEVGAAVTFGALEQFILAKQKSMKGIEPLHLLMVYKSDRESSLSQPLM